MTLLVAVYCLFKDEERYDDGGSCVEPIARWNETLGCGKYIGGMRV